MRGERRSAPAQRFQIFDRAIGEAVLQPRPNLRAVVLRPFAQPGRVGGGGFDGKHDQGGGGERGLIRQIDLDDLDAELPKVCQGCIERGGDVGLQVIDVETCRNADFQSLR